MLLSIIIHVSQKHHKAGITDLLDLGDVYIK